MFILYPTGNSCHAQASSPHVLGTPKSQPDILLAPEVLISSKHHGESLALVVAIPFVITLDQVPALGEILDENLLPRLPIPPSLNKKYWKS